MAARILGATSIDTLKNIDGDYLQQDDLCILLNDDGVYFYKLYTGMSSDEDHPYIVKPSNNDDNKRGFILPITELTENVRLDENASLELSNIKLGEGQVIKLYDNHNNNIGEIRDNKVNLSIDVYTTGIYPDTVNGIDSSKLIFSDGSTSFTNPINSPDPEIDAHLANKRYVDTETTALSGNIAEYKDFVDDNFAKGDNTEEHIPSHDYNPATKKYVDDEITGYSEFINDLENYYARGDNTTEQTPTGEYNPATKQYVDKYAGVTGNYIKNDDDAIPHNGYIIDASLGPVTLNLPENVDMGTTVIATVIDISHTVKIDPQNGKILGEQDVLYIDVSDSGLTLTYTGLDYGGAIVSEISGVSPLDGDTIEISWNPINYIPNSDISEAEDSDDLASHLKGIDEAFISPKELKTESEPDDPIDQYGILYLSDGSASDENEGDLIFKVNIDGDVRKKFIATY